MPCTLTSFILCFIIKLAANNEFFSFTVTLVKYLKKPTHFWETVNSWLWCLPLTFHRHEPHIPSTFSFLRNTFFSSNWADFQDALRPDRNSATHFALPRVKYFRPSCNTSSFIEFEFHLLYFQALEEVRKIRPKRTLFTGILSLLYVA